MKKMTIEEIKEHSISSNVTRANTVYQAKRNTFISVDPDGDKSTHNNIDMEVAKGSLAIISGCGDQSKNGISAYMIGDKWGASFDSDWELFANEPGVEIDA